MTDVDALLAEHPDDVATAVRRLRELVLRAQPQLAERVQPGWHAINYRDPDAGFVCAIVPVAGAVRLALVHGAQLPDPEGRLRGSGKQLRALVFATADDVDEDVVARYLDLTVELCAARRGR